MPHVEERVAFLARERRLDRRVVADGDRQHRPRLAADVQPRHVIDRVAERVRRERIEPVPWTQPRARLQRVVPRFGDRERRTHEAERGEHARSDARRRREDRNRRIDLHEDGQVRAA